MSTTTRWGFAPGRSSRASATVPASNTCSTSHRSRSIPARRSRTRLESSTRKTRMDGCIGDKCTNCTKAIQRGVGVGPSPVCDPRADVSVAAYTLGRQSMLDDVADQVSVGLQVQLAQNPAAIRGDGLGADLARGRDLLVGPAPTQETQHLILAGGEGRVCLARRAARERVGEEIGQGRTDVAPY